MSRGGVRYGIFVHDPDGDMGYGRIVGAFKTPSKAALKAEQIRARVQPRGMRVECIVVPVLEGSASDSTILAEVLEQFQ